MSDIRGVPLRKFEEPIRTALAFYSDISDGRVTFDIDQAAQLTPTPEKPYSARSATTVKFMGETATKLYVIAFAPQEGSGDESTYSLGTIDAGNWPRNNPAVVPRPKAGTYAEGLLTIASSLTESPQVDPVIFANRLTLLGLDEYGTISKLADLGKMSRSAGPTTVLTVGTHKYNGERFGDPHAVFNNYNDAVQVCGFVAVAQEAKDQMGLLEALNAVEPLMF